MRVLELFSGTGSVGKVCQEKGYEVISLDLKNADINCNILEWNYKDQFPERYFDIIWASPPCNSFSILQNSRKTKEEIYKNIEENGLPILEKTLEIIQYFKPKYYFIENPDTGRMKQYLDLPFYVLDYCKYENWGYRKRTRIWTNKEDFVPKICKRDCTSMCMSANKKYHQISIGGNSHSRKTIGREKKYRIPSNLIEELLF